MPLCGDAGKSEGRQLLRRAGLAENARNAERNRNGWFFWFVRINQFFYRCRSDLLVFVYGKVLVILAELLVVC